MANLIIKSSADDLVLKGSGGNSAITVAAAGTTTFAQNATLSGTANNLGTVTAGTLGAGSILNGTRLTDLKSTDGGESAITCDASGYVKLPQMPFFYVSHSTASNIIDPDGIIPFNTVDFSNGISYSTSTHKATVPTEGLYYFRCHTICEGDVQQAINLQQNSTIKFYTHCSSGNTWQDIMVEGILECSASDTVFPNLYLSGTGTYDWHGGTYSSFYGYLIG